MSIQTASEYWSCLEKSGLFDDLALADLKQRFRDTDQAPLLARRLIDCGSLTDWQARFLLSGRHQLNVGQYRLQERIPSPVIGDRFVALHTRLNRVVEINLFPAGIAENNEVFAELLARAAVVARLDHPNLVNLFDIEQEAGRYFFVFEHDPGTPLDQVPAGQLDSGRIANIAFQLLDGLDYAHARQLIHGQLCESDIRLEGADHARISNLGLSSMLDQLQNEENRMGQFSIQPVAADDAVAAGKIMRQVFDRQIGPPQTPQQNALVGLLDDLARMVNGTDKSAAEYRNQLDAWLKADPSPDPAAALMTDPAGVPAGVAMANQLESGLRPAPKPAKPPEPEPETPPATRLIATIVSAVTCLIVIGLLAYLIWGRGDEQASGLAQNRLWESTPTGKRGGAPVNNQREKGPRRTALDKALEEAQPEANAAAAGQKLPVPGPEPGSDKATAAGSAPGKATGAAADPVAGSGNPEPPVTAAVPEPVSPPEPAEPVADGEMVAAGGIGPAGESLAGKTAVPPQPGPAETLDGLPVIDWEQAAEFDGQTVAVRGRIVKLGQTRGGDIRFLNFDDQAGDSFTVIVRERNLEAFSQPLEVLYRDQDVIVSGEISLYEGRVPQIEVTSPGQIVTGSMRARAAPAAGGTASAAFAKLPLALDLPPYAADQAGQRHLLGRIQSGKDLLGIEFLPLSGFAPRGGAFSVERDSDDVTTWHVRYANRSTAEPETIARFSKTGDQFWFEWVGQPAAAGKVNGFRNGLLRIRTPTESQLCQLRAPVTLDPPVLTMKKPQFREEFPIGDLPETEYLLLEIKPFSKEVFPDLNTETGLELNARQTTTEVFFHRDVFQRVLAIRYEFRPGTRTRLDAGLYVNGPDGFVHYRDRTFRQLGETVAALQARTAAEKQAADAYEAPYGQKTKHADYVKELSKQLDLINAQVESYRLATDRVPQILDRPIEFRVLFRTEEGEVLLAATSGWDNDPDQPDAQGAASGSLPMNEGQ